MEDISTHAGVRLLGVDYGRGRCGLALGDTQSRLATPLEVLSGADSLAELVRGVLDVARKEGIMELVIGVPFPLEDQTRETSQAKEIRQMMDLCRDAGFVVHEQNETWSTRLAERQSHESNRRGPSDDLAAAAILQSYLDRPVHAR